MTIIHKWNGVFGKLVRKVLFRIKLLEMDEWWYFTGANSWGVIKPSFYYTHTEEEIRRIRTETAEMLRKLMEDGQD